MSYSGYRIAFDEQISQAEINASDTYLIEQYPIQSDQTPGRQWQRPGNEADRVLQVGEVAESLDGWRDGMGYPEFTWSLRALSPKMINYIAAQGFPNGVYARTCTVQTYNRNTGEWEAYWAIARRPHESEYELFGGGADNWQISFVKCLESTAGPDVTPTLTISDTTPDSGSTVTITADVDNEGDTDTFADIVCTISLGGFIAYQDNASGSSWSLEVSDDSGSNWYTAGDSGSYTAASITDVRGTRSTALDTSTTASITFTVVPPTGGIGPFTITSILTNTGDTDTTNNTDSGSVTVNP